MAHVNTPARLRALRTVMNVHQIDAYLVLSSDPHLSEYLPEHWQSRAWLSGFDGSAGTLLVTAHEAGLWTDSRYWAQAEHSLEGSGITLFKQGAPGVLGDRKSTRLNSSHVAISYAVFCLKKKSSSSNRTMCC